MLNENKIIRFVNYWAYRSSDGPLCYQNRYNYVELGKDKYKDRRSINKDHVRQGNIRELTKEEYKTIELLYA